MSRHRFNRWLAAGACPALIKAQIASEQKLRAAALQMTPKPGDVQANLEQAEQLIRQAQREGATDGGRLQLVDADAQ